MKELFDKIPVKKLLHFFKSLASDLCKTDRVKIEQNIFIMKKNLLKINFYSLFI